MAEGFELGHKECCAVDCSELKLFSPLSMPVKWTAKCKRKKKLRVRVFFENLDRFLSGLGLQVAATHV